MITITSQMRKELDAAEWYFKEVTLPDKRHRRTYPNAFEGCGELKPEYYSKHGDTINTVIWMSACCNKDITEIVYNCNYKTKEELMKEIDTLLKALDRMLG